MKKIILSMLLISLINCAFWSTCFASVNESVTFSCYATTNLTKSITISGTDNIYVDWGDSNNDEFIASGEVRESFTHTYSQTGTYQVTITATDITKLILPENDIFEINLTQATLLKILDLSDNKITNLDLTKNLKL